MTEDQLKARIKVLENENALLRTTVEIQKRQMQIGGFDREVKRLRAKIAEWEGSTTLMNGGYYHGARFIRPYDDNPPEAH